jgi:antirestriction protein ArdC
MMKSKRDIEQQITNKIIDQLEKGVAPWRKSWVGGGLALRENGVPYRGYNQFLLSLSGCTNPYWLTYNRVTALGGQVRKGEKGTHVYFFKRLEVKDKVTGEDKKIPLIRFYSVFNAEQCDDLPEKYHPKPVERTEVERDAGAEAYLANIGADVRHGGSRAFYSPSTDFIQLPEVNDFDNYVSYVGTSIHEHAHWTGHESRLDRDIKNQNGTRDYAREELVAEASAALICGHLGIEVEPREDHAAYLASWLEVLKDDKTALRKAFSKAQKVVDFLDELQLVEQQEAA